MSRTTTYVIDKHGELESVGETPNSWSFTIAIWQHQLAKHDLGSTTTDLRILGRLWSRVGKLERADGLVVAATFDRCWFPRAMVDELIDALRAATYSTGPQVADVLAGIDFRRRDRGVTFQGSLASPWGCATTDGWHVIDRAGHACTGCGKKIQNAEHMLAEVDCCREPEDATYSKDAG